MSTSKRTIFITGCSAGSIGHALALTFHARGHRVFATARTLDSMQELHEKGIETFKLDVCKTDEIQLVKAKVAELTGGSLDLLVHSAGVFNQTPFSDLTMQRIRAEMDVNFFSVAEITLAFLPLLLESTDARVLLLGSVAAYFPTPFYSIYNASKAAMAQLGNTLRVELAPFNIKVIQTLTGPVKTNILKEEKLPPGSLYTPVKHSYERSNPDVFGKAAIPVDGFAEQLATEVLKKNPRYVIWNGANAMVWRMLATMSHATGWIGSCRIRLV
ncbi:hypothetical protein EIP91_009929 [Steccherinum ochraceum]|uniref:Ketoreductase domain-containing protein n=1 Tax=Steccherinum ochraceum TaxID=92696 RepID=A0A4R0R3R0_9APHY|nr:hypothetical protein EIP91_009929 [Steccherinum ochraceum]